MKEERLNNVARTDYLYNVNTVTVGTLSGEGNVHRLFVADWQVQSQADRLGPSQPT